MSNISTRRRTDGDASLPLAHGSKMARLRIAGFYHGFLTFVYLLCKLNLLELPSMEIGFGTKKMQRNCSSEKAMRAEWGTHNAKKLMLRLTEMEAAETLEDLARLPQARCHEYKGEEKGKLSVDLAHPFRLIFEPDQDPVPTKPDGGLDWKAVTRIRILYVHDPH
jgi:plasmid maintenance system killer protein